MNKNQVNRLEMQNAVINYLDSSSAKWSSIPIIGEFKNEFVSVNDNILQSQEAQQSAQVFVGKTKRQLKGTIAQKADIYNDVIEAFALVNGDIDLEKRMSTTYSYLYEMRNIDFIPKVQEVVAAAEANKTALETEYGTTSEQLDDLKIDIDQFLVLNGKPRAYKIASVQATKDLEQLFSDAHELLTNKLDKAMKIFKRRDSNFYNGYLAARVVVDN